jgi:hypothetical protein
VADRKRAFVTSNSKNLVTRLNEALNTGTAGDIRTILVSSETIGNDEVKEFIANPAARALDYDVIFTSPSLGTGVDITAPGQQSIIDVVYGFFETNITTHFDIDQQIWRVRQPGSVKIWINPRRFSFETSREVVKQEIQQKQLFKSVLSDYDDNLTPQYHTDDPLIDMAVLARSHELMSKNNLKRNYIAMKRRHGHAIEFVDRDDELAGQGSALDAEGRLAADARYRERLFMAKTLNRTEYEEIESRIEENEDVSMDERIAFAKTRIEKFYRQPLSDEIIGQDDRARFRAKIVRFEQLIQFAVQERLNNYGAVLKPSKEYEFRLRVLKDSREIARLLHDLLTASGIFVDGHFDTQKIFSSITLKPFMHRSHEIKATIENLLEIEVRKLDAGARQLNSVLDVVGLEHEAVATTRVKSVAGGKKVYLYRLSTDRLAQVQEIVKRREQISGWAFIDQRYGFDIGHPSEPSSIP